MTRNAKETVRAKAGSRGAWLRAAPLRASLAALALAAPCLGAPPSLVYDIADANASDGTFMRVRGSAGNGKYGVPLCGPADFDNDGFMDYAIAFLTASPLGRAGAGEVDLVFGDGSITVELDTAVNQSRILRIYGAAASEAAGGEVWQADVNGDGVADLIICRQNFTPGPGRIGAGAFTIILGGPELRTLAASLQPLDFAAPEPGIRLVTFVGMNQYDRLGIWTRTGDVSSDGVDDIIAGMDQYDLGAESNNGSVFVIRGGAHLSVPRTIDLADFGSTPIEGHIAWIKPKPGTAKWHLGATAIISDLDGDGHGEAIMAATLRRAGAVLPPAGAPPGTAEASGGSPDGTTFIVWGENFVRNRWPIGYTIPLSNVPRALTVIDGAGFNQALGEELAGADFSGDGNADLFLGDLIADGTAPPSRPFSGMGFVIYRAGDLRDLSFDLDAPPPGVTYTKILGPSENAIGADTVIPGDFDDDGLADLAFGSPHDAPQARENAGIIHVLYGKAGGWPAIVDTAFGNLPSPSAMRIAEIHGALGSAELPDMTRDEGDTLCYSMSAGDANGDGKDDIVTNEMQGNGFTLATVDVGNLLIISGDALLRAPSAARGWQGYE